VTPRTPFPKGGEGKGVEGEGGGGEERGGGGERGGERGGGGAEGGEPTPPAKSLTNPTLLITNKPTFRNQVERIRALPSSLCQ